MKILGSRQVVKTTRVASSVPLSNPDSSCSCCYCCCCPCSSPLSPSWTGTVPSVTPCHGSANNALEKQVSIATNNLELGCRIRQDKNICKRYSDRLDCWRMLWSNNLDAEWIDQDVLLCRWLANGICRTDSDGLPVSPPEVSQIRKYRKSVSVRWGSLKWSLDLVMVVKSRSSSKSSSRSCKVNTAVCEEGSLCRTRRSELQHLGGTT